MKRVQYTCDLCKKQIDLVYSQKKMISTEVGEFHEHCIFERLLVILRSRSVEEALGLFTAALTCTPKELMFEKDPSTLLTLQQQAEKSREVHKEMHSNSKEEQGTREENL